MLVRFHASLLRVVALLLMAGCGEVTMHQPDAAIEPDAATCPEMNTADATPLNCEPADCELELVYINRFHFSHINNGWFGTNGWSVLVNHAGHTFLTSDLAVENVSSTPNLAGLSVLPPDDADYTVLDRVLPAQSAQGSVPRIGWPEVLRPNVDQPWSNEHTEGSWMVLKIGPLGPPEDTVFRINATVILAGMAAPITIELTTSEGTGGLIPESATKACFVAR